MAYIIKDSSHFNTDNLLFDDVLIKNSDDESRFGTGVRSVFYLQNNPQDTFNGIRLTAGNGYSWWYIRLDNNNNPTNIYYNYGD